MKFLARVFIAFLVFVPVFSLLPEYSKADDVKCYCVLYIRTTYDVPIFGDAYKHRPNLAVSEVKVGDIALFRYGQVYHAAMVTRLEDNGVFSIEEANYRPCQVSYRTLSLLDPNLRGFYRP